MQHYLGLWVKAFDQISQDRKVIQSPPWCTRAVLTCLQTCLHTLQMWKNQMPQSKSNCASSQVLNRCSLLLADKVNLGLFVKTLIIKENAGTKCHTHWIISTTEYDFSKNQTLMVMHNWSLWSVGLGAHGRSWNIKADEYQRTAGIICAAETQQYNSCGQVALLTVHQDTCEHHKVHCGALINHSSSFTSCWQTVTVQLHEELLSLRFVFLVLTKLPGGCWFI